MTRKRKSANDIMIFMSACLLGFLSLPAFYMAAKGPTDIQLLGCGAIGVQLFVGAIILAAIATKGH